MSLFRRKKSNSLKEYDTEENVSNVEDVLLSGKDDLDEQSVSLMMATKEGNIEAFSQLVKLHQKSLMNFFYRCGVYSDVEDIAQETFLKLYRAKSSYERRAKFTTYLYMIARQVMIDYIRKSERRSVLTEALAEEVDDFVPKNEFEGEGLDVRDALKVLSLPLREAVVLVVMQGFAYQEAADVLGVPVGTVKSRVSNGLTQLKSYMLGNNAKKGTDK